MQQIIGVLLHSFNCLEVAFDEVVQWSRETIPISEETSYPYVLHAQPRPLTGTMTVVELLHSLVCTCRFWLSKSDGKPYDHQEAVLPPQSIYSTDNVTVCKGLLLVMESRIFGCGFRDWITKLSTSGLELMLCLVSADYASSNLNVLDLLRAIVLVRAAIAVACCVWFHFERCGCHQLMRASVSVAAVTEEKKAQRSKSKLLRLRRARDNFKLATLAQYEQQFEFNGVKKSPAELEARARCVDILVDFFKVKSCGELFHEAAWEGGDESQPHDGEQLQAMEDFFAFHNNSSPLDQMYSRLEPDERVTREQAVKEGQRLLSIALFKTAVPQWNEARMLRYLACQRYWCLYNVLVPVQAMAWQNF